MSVVADRPWKPASIGGAWWEKGYAAAALTGLAALPVLPFDVAPLVDLPGHIGRYRVQLDAATDPSLAQFYQVRWSVIGNLGVDLLVLPLAPLIGLEPAVKLIVAAIPALTAAAFLLLAREVHGRVPPTALFALPLAYNHAFLFGFVNFALSMALAFAGLAYWLRLGRTGRPRYRAVLFAALAPLLWIVHALGWASLGMMTFAAELAKRRGGGRSWRDSLLGAGIATLPLAPPLVLTLLWQAETPSGATVGWLDYERKAAWLLMILRDRWMILDLASLAPFLLLPAAMLWARRLEADARVLAGAAALLAGFLLMPRMTIGSSYGDMRLAPYAAALAMLSARVPARRSARFAGYLALAGLAFFVLRLGSNAASFGIAHRAIQTELGALAHIPPRARLLSFVGRPCETAWALPRHQHLPSFALLRRGAFANDQWAGTGAQLLRVRFDGGGFVADPSHVVTPTHCPGRSWLTLDQALRTFPAESFSHLWLIDPPAYDTSLVAGMRPLWRSGRSALFRIEPGVGAQRTDPPARARPAARPLPRT